MLNRVIEIGRLAADPELKYTPSGIAVAKVTVAVNRRKQDEPADFIPCVLWRHNAEFAANYCTKGDLVAVEGRLQIRTYVEPSGTKRWIFEVVADEFKKLTPKKKEGEASEAPGAYGGDAYPNAPPQRGSVPPAGVPPQGYPPPPPPQGQTYTPPPAPPPPPSVQETPPPPMQPDTAYPVMSMDEPVEYEDPFADE